MIGWPALRVADALPSSTDVVIVGGGIVGAATAFFARRAGLRVVLLEKRPALCTLTTPVSTGAFRLQFDNPEEIKVVREGIDLFDHFADARIGSLLFALTWCALLTAAAWVLYRKRMFLKV